MKYQNIKILPTYFIINLHNLDLPTQNDGKDIGKYYS